MLGKIKGPEKPDSQTYESKNKKKDLIFEIFKCFFLVQLHLALELIL